MSKGTNWKALGSQSRLLVAVELIPRVWLSLTVKILL